MKGTRTIRGQAYSSSKTLPLPNSRKPFRKSPGNGAVKVISFSEKGWMRLIDRAWSAWRLKHFRIAEAKTRSEGAMFCRRSLPPPYKGSPTMGNPLALQCTRIWCVRPVEGINFTRAIPDLEPSTLYSVREALPAMSATRFTGSRLLRANAKSMTPLAKAGTPMQNPM